jgi:thiol-disulfide isomerase/thioredoxin
MSTTPLTSRDFQVMFEKGLGYEGYVAAGKPHEVENWRGFHARVALTAGQRALLGSLTRKVNALCISGTWCGDCVQQCPMFDHIAKASAGKIEMRFLERDAHAEFAEHFKICSGARVPVLILLNEDFDFCAFAGDRTLSRYRSLAARQLGGACPLPGAPVATDEIAATVQDWVEEFERVQLMLRLSGKLRQRYGD